MADPIFVVQEHHASTHHWDFRLEHHGVLRSWAVPKGIPPDSEQDRLAIPTDDHALEFAEFEGTIPEGEYGAGSLSVWDIGTYRKLKWTTDEIVVVLAGRRLQGAFSLFQIKGGNWLIHRMRPTQC